MRKTEAKDLRLNDEVILDDGFSRSHACVDALGPFMVRLFVYDTNEHEEYRLPSDSITLCCGACDADASTGGRVNGKAFCAECVEAEAEAARADREESDYLAAQERKHDLKKEGF